MGNHRRLLAMVVLLLAWAGALQAAAPPTLTGVDRHGDPLPRGAIARLGTGRMRSSPTLGTHCQVIFSADGKSLLSRGEKGFLLYDRDTGRTLAWRPSGNKPAAARLLADGKTLVTASLGPDWFVERWQWDRLAPPRRVALPRVPGGIGLPNQGLLSADGKLLVSWSYGSDLVLFDAESGLLRHRIGPFTEAEPQVALTPDGNQLILGSNDGLHVYDTATGKRLRELARNEGGFTSTKYLGPEVSPDGKRLVVSARKQLLLLELRTGKRLARREGIYGLPAFSPDGKWLACSTPRAIHLLDARTLQVVRIFEPHREPSGGASLAFSRDGKTLAQCGGDAITLWNVATGKALPRPPGHLSAVRSLAFSPDGRRLASGGEDGIAYVWDLETNRALHAFAGHYRGVMGLAFSPDGRVLATGDGIRAEGVGMSRVRLYDLDMGRLVRQFPRHLNNTWSLVFSPDGRRLA